MTFNSTICTSFEPENPFTSNYIDISRTRNKRPCVISHKSMVFVLHSLLPTRYFNSVRKKTWFIIRICGCMEDFGRKRIGGGTSYHWMCFVWSRTIVRGRRLSRGGRRVCGMWLGIMVR